MRLFIAVLILFGFTDPSVAVAPSSQSAPLSTTTTFHATFRCRLSDDLCHSVYRELGKLTDAQLKDAQKYRRYPLEERIDLIANRNFARLQRRLPQLRKDVGQEVLRLHLCAAKDRLAAANGTAYSTNCDSLAP